MDSSKKNFWIDIVLFVLMIVTLVTGIMLKLRIREFMGFTGASLKSYHGWIGIGFVLIIFLHLFLHKGWIKFMFKNK